jgi:hypothetical protein
LVVKQSELTVAFLSADRRGCSLLNLPMYVHDNIGRLVRIQLTTLLNELEFETECISNLVHLFTRSKQKEKDATQSMKKTRICKP